jgi:hypothetical protein
MHWLLERIRDFGARPALAMADGVCDYARLAELTAGCIDAMDAAGVVPGDSPCR